MKVKLDRDHGFAREDGTTQNFFGVPFTCVNREAGEDRVLSEWFTDIPAKDAREMAKAGRVEILETEKEKHATKS